MILFASRGNESNSGRRYPALSPGVHPISAYDTGTGRISSYSSFGEVWAASVGDVVNWLLPSGAEQTANGGGTSAASALATHMAARLKTNGRSAGNVISYLKTHARRTGASPVYEGAGVLQLDSAVNQLLRDKPQRTNLDGTLGTGVPPQYEGSVTGTRDGCLT